MDERGSMTAADLKAWRERLGLTQRQAAEALRCSYRTLQGWEAGWATPGMLPIACQAIEEKYKASE